MYSLSGNSPVIADERISAGHVKLITNLDSCLSKSPPKYPSLPAPYPTMTMTNNVIITVIISKLTMNSIIFAALKMFALVGITRHIEGDNVTPEATDGHIYQSIVRPVGTP